MVRSILAKKYFLGAIWGPKIPLKPLKMAILRPNLKNYVPEYSEWPSIVDFSAKNDGGVHFGGNFFLGAIQGPKMPAKYP